MEGVLNRQKWPQARQRRFLGICHWVIDLLDIAVWEGGPDVYSTLIACLPRTHAQLHLDGMSFGTSTSRTGRLSPPPVPLDSLSKTPHRHRHRPIWLPNPPAGVLCREFLSAHLSPSTPVVMSGSSGCDGGGDASSAVVLGGLMYEEELDAQSTSLIPNDIAVEPPQSERGEGVQTDSSSSALALAGTTDDPAVVPAAGEPVTSTCDCRATAAATVAGEVGGASETWPRSRDGTGTGKGEKEPGREGDVGPGAGAVVDVCTVGDLYPWRNTYGVTGRGELLRLGFLRQQVNGGLVVPSSLLCCRVFGRMFWVSSLLAFSASWCERVGWFHRSNCSRQQTISAAASVGPADTQAGHNRGICCRDRSWTITFVWAYRPQNSKIWATAVSVVASTFAWANTQSNELQCCGKAYLPLWSRSSSYLRRSLQFFFLFIRAFDSATTRSRRSCRNQAWRRRWGWTGGSLKRTTPRGGRLPRTRGTACTPSGAVRKSYAQVQLVTVYAHLKNLSCHDGVPLSGSYFLVLCAFGRQDSSQMLAIREFHKHLGSNVPSHSFADSEASIAESDRLRGMTPFHVALCLEHACIRLAPDVSTCLAQVRGGGPFSRWRGWDSSPGGWGYSLLISLSTALLIMVLLLLTWAQTLPISLLGPVVLESVLLAAKTSLSAGEPSENVDMLLEEAQRNATVTGTQQSKWPEKNPRKPSPTSSPASRMKIYCHGGRALWLWLTSVLARCIRTPLDAYSHPSRTGWKSTTVEGSRVRGYARPRHSTRPGHDEACQGWDAVSILSVLCCVFVFVFCPILSVSYLISPVLFEPRFGVAWIPLRFCSPRERSARKELM